MSAMRRLLIEPRGWLCSLEEAPPGPFINPKWPNMLCFKSEYHNENNKIMAYNVAGEYYGDEGLVQPVEMIEQEE